MAKSNPKRKTDAHLYRMSLMKLGCEAPGVTVDVVSGVFGDPIQAFELLRVTHGSESFVPRQLNELRHHVQITDGPTALRYARLITSPETWFLWKSQTPSVEIMEAGAVDGVPNFGLNREWLCAASPSKKERVKGGFQYTYWIYSWRRRKMERLTCRNDRSSPIVKTINSPDFTILGDGRMGILTRKAYQAGKFSPPSILPVNGGFQLTRWLLVEDYSGKKPKDSVQQVQEFVGTDGEYRRTILKAISPPPSLPGIRLALNRYK